MQIQQRVVLRQQRTQPVGDVIFELLWLRGRLQATVEVALALAATLLPRQRIGNRHEGDAATADPELPAVERREDLTDGDAAADLVAMYGAEHDQTRAVFLTVEAM